MIEDAPSTKAEAWHFELLNSMKEGFRQMDVRFSERPTTEQAKVLMADCLNAWSDKALPDKLSLALDAYEQKAL